VQVERVAETAVPGGEHAWRAVGEDPDVADQSGVEHRVQVVAIGPAALAVPSQPRTRRAGQCYPVR